MRTEHKDTLPRLSERSATGPGNLERRQVLGGLSLCMVRATLPAIAVGAVTAGAYVARPGGWILRESDRDVS